MDEWGEESLKHLRNLVPLRTNTQEDPGFSEHRACVEYLKGQAEAMGFHARVLATQGRPSLVAWKGPAGGRTLVLNGHYDVVPDNVPWNSYRLTKGTHKGRKVLFGKGVADMKGGIACMLEAAGKARLAKSRKLVLMFVPDEETGGKHGTEFALRQCVKDGTIDPQKTVAIVGEPTQLDVTTRRRANYVFSIDIPRESEVEGVAGLAKRVEYGKSLHSAHTSVSNFRYGRQKHPLFELSEAYFAGKLMGVQEVRLGGSEGAAASAVNVVPTKGTAYYRPARLPEEGTHKLMHLVQKLFHPPFHSEFSHYGISVCPNRLERINGSYRLWLDLRVMNNNRQQVTASVKRMARESGIPPSGVRLDNYKHTLEQNGNWPKKVAEIIDPLTPKPVTYKREGRGQSDASFFAAREIPVVELGCEGGKWHAPGEYMAQSSLEILSRAYAKLIESPF